MNKVITTAIIGGGARGLDTYGSIMKETPERFQVVACCDIRRERLNLARDMYGLSEDCLFSDENEFFKEKRADLLLVTTLDAMHVPHGLKGLALGYDILMEKPISDNEEELSKLLEAQEKYGGKVLVCHVLRYAPAYRKVKELLDGGTVGRLICIEAAEQVAYWHQAHSFVRGNWRREDETVPMILAKCCHDLDLLQWYAQSPCESVSSIGDLSFFKAENAPAEAKDRCLDCPLADTCLYSAKRFYLDERFRKGKTGWPVNVVCVTKPLTEEALTEALRTGPYGRCVFRCDNDVVDHQLTQLTFRNGIKASLTMTAFTNNGGRIMYFRGTEGEVILDEQYDTITVKHFGKGTEVISINELSADTSDGHGGGDSRLIDCLYETLTSSVPAPTTLTASVESHLIGIAAEKSRKAGGALVRVHG